MKAERLLVVGLVVVVATAGCQGGSLVGSPTPTPTIAPPVSITFLFDINESGGGYTIEGEISEAGFVFREQRYEDVRVLFFSREGEKVGEVAVGSFETDREVSATLDRLPYYVIVTSPDFWESDNVAVNYYVRVGGGVHLDCAVGVIAVGASGGDQRDAVSGVFPRGRLDAFSVRQRL